MNEFAKEDGQLNFEAMKNEVFRSGKNPLGYLVKIGESRLGEIEKRNQLFRTFLVGTLFAFAREETVKVRVPSRKDIARSWRDLGTARAAMALCLASWIVKPEDISRKQEYIEELENKNPVKDLFDVGQDDSGVLAEETEFLKSLIPVGTPKQKALKAILFSPLVTKFARSLSQNFY